MVLTSSPPPVYGNSRKTTQEKKRRDEINAKIKELQKLIQNDSDAEKMTQSDVLIRAVELVTRMEAESPGPSHNPNRKGFFDGFSTVENLTQTFIKSLGMSADVCNEYVHGAKQVFDRERASLVMPSSGSGKRKSEAADHLLHIPAHTYSQSSSPSTSESGVSMDRKELKKNREQDRRDRQGEAFTKLRDFIIQNKLTTSHQVEKMQRLNTLDIIISYIQNKKNNFVSNSGPDQALYAHAVAEGQKTARHVALRFFKSDRHLIVRCADLEKFFELSLASTPLAAFPMPLAPPAFPMCAPIFPFGPFPFIPMGMAVSPLSTQSPPYSLDSSPPSSDTSSSSMENLSAPTENSSVTKVCKIFRPWE